MAEVEAIKLAEPQHHHRDFLEHKRPPLTVGVAVAQVPSVRVTAKLAVLEFLLRLLVLRLPAPVVVVVEMGTLPQEPAVLGAVEMVGPTIMVILGWLTPVGVAVELACLALHALAETAVRVLC